jgi:lysophospholipase L1-like esterase
LTLALGAAACSKGSGGGSPVDPTPTAGTTYTAIGASDGIGVGSSSVCVPFTECPNGAGYVQILARRLPTPVSILNLSIPGAVMSRAIENLATQIGSSVPGNFVEREAPFVSTSATHVTIFAGGNDANIIARAVRAGAGGSDIRGYVDGQVRQWGTDLEDLVSRIRARAPNARIVALNLPNLAAAPYVAGNTVEERGILQRIAVGLSERVNALTGRNVLVIDLLCDARVIQPGSFSSDGFHPSDAGYQLMADLTFPVLSTGQGTTPLASCPTRTVVPVY